MKLRSIVGVSLVLLAGIGGGVLLQRHVLSMADMGTAQAPAGRKVLYWWDPMMPAYRSDEPGKSPMGMDMVPVYEGAAPSSEATGVVTVSPAVMQSLGVRAAVATRTSLTPVIETFGTVGFDESRISHVHVRAKGWIERLQTRVEGQTVARGDLLFEFFSPELISAASEFTRELQRGGGEMAEIARRKLLALGLAERQIADLRQTRQVPERIQVFAPRSGAVTGLNLADGMFIEPDKTLLSITELDSVWVMAEVIESQAAFARPGMAAEVRLPSDPGRVWSAVVDYIYPELRPETRTVRLRLRLSNPDRLLRPNMFAAVRLAATPRTGVLAIPAEALIRTGQGERVVLALEGGRFKPVPVKAGITVGDQVEVLEGLQEGDRVVTSAQFLLDSESSLIGGLKRMETSVALGAVTPSDSLFWTEATVNGPMSADGMVTLSHPPIPAIGWPAMTMDFAIDPKVPATALVPGRPLRVALGRNPDGTYRVVAAEATAAR